MSVETSTEMTSEQIQADLSSLGRVGHRLAMIDNATQFESVAGKLLPRLLTRMGSNQQQQLSPQNAPIKPLLQQVQAKLMEILSHILKRVKESGSRDPLPCHAILSLLVNDPTNNSSDAEELRVLNVKPGVDALTRNLSLTFLTVGVPKCTNPATLVPGLLVCLVHERQQQRQSTASTLTMLLLQSLVGLSSAALSSPTAATTTDDLKAVRTFLQQHQGAAAVLYELLLDVFLWTAPQTAASSLPPAGLSQQGKERLEQAISNQALWGDMTKTKVALLELIAPARKALFLGNLRDQQNPGAARNLARTLALLLVTKADPLTMERAQTYWQMYFSNQGKTIKSNSNKKMRQTPSETVSQQQQPQQQQQSSGEDDPAAASNGDSDGLAMVQFLCESLSLTLGQAQAEEIASRAATYASNMEGASPATADQSAQPRALPLHCDLAEPKSANAENDSGTIVWASKRRAVALTPTAGTIWAALASQLEHLRSDLQQRNDDGVSITMVVAEMVQFLASKHLGGSQGPSSAMSTLQAKPYFGLAQLLHAVTVEVCNHGDTRQVEQLQSSFMEIVCQVLKRQVTTATAASLSSSSGNMIMNTEGSWAVREECYSIICHLCRSNSSANPAQKVVTTDTASLLFACAAKEHERLRPRSVAALDALLEAFTRNEKSRHAQTISDAAKMDTEASPSETTAVPANPWANIESKTEASNNNSSSDELKRASLAKSLVPLLWNAAQTHQPKASRVAAARWAAELLKKNKLDLVRGCHLLCFLAGDADVTAASIANQGLFEGLDLHEDDDGLPAMSLGSAEEADEGDDPNASFPDFGSFTEIVFQQSPGETRVQQYYDFSFLGKAAALRYGLLCLMADIYGGEDDGVGRYLDAMTKTLVFFAQESKSAVLGRDRTSIDLLDQCSVCLLTTLKSSRFARTQLSKSSTPSGLSIMQLEDLATAAGSSKARRHLAGVIGTLYEDNSLWNAKTFSEWMSETGANKTLARCVDQMSHLTKNHFQLGKLHGIIFLSGRCLRAIRHRLLGSGADESSAPTEQVWGDCTRILKLLGAGILHKEEVISNASVGSVGIALSFDSLDAPRLDQHLNDGAGAVLQCLSTAIKRFSEGDVVDPFRATGLVRAGGILLGATSLAQVSDEDQLHKSRHSCVEAILATLGSMAFRKDEEIALAAGEALGRHADSCNYERSGLSWPEDFQEEFSLKLPPQEYVLYYLITHNLKASSPHKRTATAPALLGLVGRAARLVHLDERNLNRSFVFTVRSSLNDVQGAFITLLADPKVKHFSRESCCLGLAACRGLATFNTEGADTSINSAVDGLNQRLLRAFGQTANFGGSAYQETRAQAEQRRAAEQGNEGNILEPFGMESEVGGAAGMGEAALGAYREMAAASLALNRPDILYALLILSVSHTAWFGGSTRDNYNAATLLGDSSIVGNRTNTTELRKALRPHLGKLLPRILRACNDPNKQTREQMGVLWAALTGGGAESREAITEHFLSTVDVLIKDASNKLWRARAGATGALAEVIVGRDWQAFGGGPPILSDDDMHDDRPTEHSGVRLLRIWRVVLRSIDDVRDTVRTNGERLGRAMRGLTMRLCDASVVEKSSGEPLTKDERAKWARDASAASATSLRYLVHHGLNQTVPESQGLCISTLVELIAIAKPAIIEPSLPDVLRSLLMAMSGLEPAALNYVQLRTENQEGLERARLQLAQSGPIATAVTKCVDLLPRAKHSVQQRVVTELDAALRLSVGFATRAAVADTASMMCNTCPSAFSFPGSFGNANPSVRLMRAFYFAAERERGQGAKDKMIHALGNIASLSPGASVRSLALRACRRYKSSTGNNDDPTSRRAAAAALRAIAVRASNQMSDGGASDVWSRFVLPVSFLGQKDSDKKAASLMKEVWDEGGVAVETSVRFGTSREEQLLPGLVKECVEALQDVSWARRIAGAKALEELCDLGVLAPLARSVKQANVTSKNELERARWRARAAHEAVGECMKVVLKPRLWSGKSSVVVALCKLVSKWTSVPTGEELDGFLFGWDGDNGKCPWMPVSMELDSASLFVGDAWFQLDPMETDDNGVNEDGARGDSDKEKTDGDSEMAATADPAEEEKINFSEMEDEGADEVAPETDAGQAKSGESSHDVLTMIGLCRALLKEALPDKRVPQYELSEEYLPYRSACLKALHDLIKTLPSSDMQRKSLLFEKTETSLLSCIKPKEDAKDEAPVIVAHAIDCLGQCFRDGFGSSDKMEETAMDPTELCVILREVSGKLQPAWTVRRAGALGLASLVTVCDAGLLRNSKVLDACMDCATYACRDKKFWRVREAGLRLLGALIRRAGLSSAQRESLILEALLPHKENMLRLLRQALSDSEPSVTALSSEVLPFLSWWP